MFSTKSLLENSTRSLCLSGVTFISYNFDRRLDFLKYEDFWMPVAQIFKESRQSLIVFRFVHKIRIFCMGNICLISNQRYLLIIQCPPYHRWQLSLVEQPGSAARYNGLTRHFVGVKMVCLYQWTSQNVWKFVLGHAKENLLELWSSGKHQTVIVAATAAKQMEPTKRWIEHRGVWTLLKVCALVYSTVLYVAGICTTVYMDLRLYCFTGYSCMTPCIGIKSINILNSGHLFWAHIPVDRRFCLCIYFVILLFM